MLGHLKAKHTTSDGNGVNSINISNLPQGPYLLKIQQADNSESTIQIIYKAD